jgi:hypothetical protein
MKRLKPNGKFMKTPHNPIFYSSYKHYEKSHPSKPHYLATNILKIIHIKLLLCNYP